MAMRFPLGSGLYGAMDPDPNLLPMHIGKAPPPLLRKPKMKLGTGMYEMQDPVPGNFALGSGLYGQAALPPEIAPAQPQPAQPQQPQSAPGGTDQTPSFTDKFGNLINNPIFQFGMNLLGGSTERNPWGTALQNTLQAQMQSSQAKRQQALADLENKRIGFEERRVGHEARGLDLRAKEIEQKSALEQQLRAMQQQNEERDYELKKSQLDFTQKKYGETELPLAQAQMAHLSGQGALKQQELAMAQDQARRQGLFFDQASQVLGGGMSNTGAAPDSPRSAPTAQPQGEVGKFGTPQWLLDSIQRVESGGNPTARGPVIHDGTRAMGAFQFIPSTVEMLKKQGYEFNPDDPVQARDAADFYLQQINKKKGGDWNATLAAYGGHVTKDPTPYINKITQGRPLPGAQGSQPAQNAPQGGGNQALKVAGLGAMAGLAGVPGASGLVEYGKMLQPQPVSPGYLRQPDGSMEYLPDPAKMVDQKVAQTRLDIDTQKAAQESQAVTEKRTQAQVDAQAELRSITGNLDRLETTASELLNHPGLVDNTGIGGALGLHKIPGTKGKDASVLLDGLKSKLVVDTLRDLKVSSSNGSSGFGSLSNDEGKILQTYFQNLDRAQTKPAMEKALKDLADFAQQSKARYADTYNQKYGTAKPSGAPALTAGTVEDGYRFKGGNPADPAAWEKAQ